MREKVVPITITRRNEGTAHECEVHIHEAFGLIGLSRVSSTGTYMFGSALEHTNLITLRIMRGEMRRHLNREWFGATERPIVEVALSPTQFAAMLTQMNMGEGVPCTITREGANAMSRVPAPRTLRETSVLEVDEHLEKMKDHAAEAYEQLNKMMTGELSMTKGNLKEAMQFVTRIHQDMGDNTDYLSKSLIERVDKQLVEAQANFEAHKEMSIRSLGIEALGRRMEGMEAGSDPLLLNKETE